MVEQEKPIPMAEIRDELYDLLVAKHGFEKATQFRTPGTIDGVTKDDVEVTGVDCSRRLAGDNARVDVNIHVPVNEREDPLFQTHSCGNREFLGQREDIVLRTRGDIQQWVERIDYLAQKGSVILLYSKKELPDFWESRM